jgi:hypothetical protein
VSELTIEVEIYNDGKNTDITNSKGNYSVITSDTKENTELLTLIYTTEVIGTNNSP